MFVVSGLESARLFLDRSVMAATRLADRFARKALSMHALSEAFVAVLPPARFDAPLNPQLAWMLASEQRMPYILSGSPWKRCISLLLLAKEAEERIITVYFLIPPSPNVRGVQLRST